MAQTSKSCHPLKTKKEASWPYYEYYLGEKDQEGRKHGEGVNHWTGAGSIERHSGQYICNAMHGYGDYRWRYRGRTGLFASYEGNFYVNSIHGYGAMSYPDGKVFTGLFYKDVRYGPGIESFACRRENVGLWRGTQLVRIPWRPAVPSLIPELQAGINGRLFVDPHRIVLRTTYQTIGKVNNALELLKACGSPPLTAFENWPKLYPKYCTDTASPLCNVDMFDSVYYNGKIIYSLEQEDTNPENFEDLELEGEDNFEDIGPYYAWNNNEVTIDMMKHCFKHEWQRENAGVRKIDFVSVLSGPRKNFQRPAMHELDSRTLLMAAYLGHVASTAYLVNKRGVEPNISDVQGNTAVMYATCGNQTDILHFLVEAGAEVDSFNDSCCTALGIALMRFACVQADIPPGDTVQAMVPPDPPGPPLKSQNILEWNINRDSTPPPHSTLQNSANKDKTSSTKTKIPIKVNSDTTKKINEESGYDSDVSLSDENKLYIDINSEFVIAVNELFSVPNGQSKYLFTTRDMVQDVLHDERLIDTTKPEKGAKKTEPKILKEKMKTSKETVWQNADGDDKEVSQTSYDIKKTEMLEKIKSTALKLLELGANPSLVRCPQPALLIAIVSSSPDLVSHLLRYGANVNEINPEMFNYSMLEVAVSLPLSYDSYRVIDVLLEGGARTDRRLPGVLVPPVPPTQPTDPPQEIPGPTLLHAIMARKPENEGEYKIRKQVVEVLLDYKCDPLIQFKGSSALELASNNMELLNIVIKNPNTDLNRAINYYNETILVKMFTIPFFKTVDANERLQTLTNLLLFGADPLMDCRNGDSLYRNIFEFAKENQTELDKSPKRIASAAVHTKSDLKHEKSKNAHQMKSVTDDAGDYRQATDLVRECARILHIRWLQAKLTKELIEIIYKYRQRLWPMILREHKSKKAAGLWLEPQRCLEIWDLFKTTNKKKYKDKRTLKHLLCMVQFYHMRSTTSYRLDPVTSTERDIIDDTIACMLKEHREAIHFDQLMMPLKRLYVQPELFVNQDSKFDVCFECALPFEEEKIECKSCKLVAFCSMHCMKENIERVSCHPCSEYLQAEFFSTPSISDGGSRDVL